MPVAIFIINFGDIPVAFFTEYFITENNILFGEITTCDNMSNQKSMYVNGVPYSFDANIQSNKVYIKYTPSYGSLPEVSGQIINYKIGSYYDVFTGLEFN